MRCELRSIQYFYFDGTFTWNIQQIRYGLQWLTFWSVAQQDSANEGE